MNPNGNTDPSHYEHGVFVVVFGIGVLIRGPAGIGKSSIALELLDRGHKLVADDIVLLQSHAQTEQDLYGTAPEMLFNLLAVRDIGILDITQIFSPQTLIRRHRLDFLIELTREGDKLPGCDMRTGYEQTIVLERKVPMRTIVASPNRNPALIVETVIKNYILYTCGQNATNELITRQQQLL